MLADKREPTSGKGFHALAGAYRGKLKMFHNLLIILFYLLLFRIVKEIYGKLLKYFKILSDKILFIKNK